MLGGCETRALLDFLLWVWPACFYSASRRPLSRPKYTSLTASSGRKEQGTRSRDSTASRARLHTAPQRHGDFGRPFVCATMDSSRYARLAMSHALLLKSG